MAVPLSLQVRTRYARLRAFRSIGASWQMFLHPITPSFSLPNHSPSFPRRRGIVIQYKPNYRFKIANRVGNDALGKDGVVTPPTQSSTKSPSATLSLSGRETAQRREGSLPLLLTYRLELKGEDCAINPPPTPSKRGIFCKCEKTKDLVTRNS